MTIFNKKSKLPKPRSSRLEHVERRPKKDDDEAISLDILDNGEKIQFIQGIWSTAHSSAAAAAASDKPMNQEIRMITAKYDILLDLLTELTLNNSGGGIVRS